ERWETTVWGIDDERRPSAHRFHGSEHRVVGAGDVLPASDLRAFVAADVPGTLLVLRSALFVGEELFVRVSSGALERRIELIEPDALKIGMAPRRFGNCGLFRWFRRWRLPRRGLVQEQNQGRQYPRHGQRIEKSSPHLVSPVTRSPREEPAEVDG